MVSRTRWLLLLGLLVVWLGLASPAPAVFPPPIKDDGKFFSAEFVEKANKKIKEIYSSSKKDLVIETYATVPEGKKLPEDKNKLGEFFAEWAKARSEELGVNGVYVLICKSPTRLQIQVDTETRKRAFTAKDRDRLQQKFIAGFKEKKFDDGLKDGIDAVEAAFRANLK